MDVLEPELGELAGDKRSRCETDRGGLDDGRKEGQDGNKGQESERHDPGRHCR